MELLQMIEQLFAEYGYLVLLIGIPLDAIALPIPPGNTTLAYTGYLAYKGVLQLGPALLAAYIGSTFGITITYLLGRQLGVPIIEKYGKWLSLKPENVSKTEEYHERFGNKILLFSYFMPGVRQFIGYFFGISCMPFRTFAIYAYTGSALWVSFFIGIGYRFGEKWQRVFLLVEDFLLYIFLGICVVVIGYLFFKKLCRRK